MNADELNELELPAHMAKASGFKQVTVDVDHALTLIAAARELEGLKSALAFLQERNFCLESPDYRATLDVSEIFESALMNGWEPAHR